MKLVHVSFNVATKNSSSIIRSLLKLATKTAIKFPIRQTVVDIVYEKVAVWKKYIDVKLRQKENLCLHWVETRKKGKIDNTFLAKIDL